MINHKWNILGTNDASFADGSGIADGAITPEKLQTATGTSWTWQSWIPTYTNLTVGNGTVVAKYIQIGKTVHAYWSIICGSTTSLGDPPFISLPVTANSRYGTTLLYSPVGSVMANDVSSAVFWGIATLDARTTQVELDFPQNGIPTTITGSFPFTETTGDNLVTQITYEAA